MKFKMLSIGLLLCSLCSLSLYAGTGAGTGISSPADDYPWTDGSDTGDESEGEQVAEKKGNQGSAEHPSEPQEKDSAPVDEKKDPASLVSDLSNEGDEKEEASNSDAQPEGAPREESKESEKEEEVSSSPETSENEAVPGAGVLPTDSESDADAQPEALPKEESRESEKEEEVSYSPEISENESVPGAGVLPTDSELDADVQPEVLPKEESRESEKEEEVSSSPEISENEAVPGAGVLPTDSESDADAPQEPVKQEPVEKKDLDQQKPQEPVEQQQPVKQDKPVEKKDLDPQEPKGCWALLKNATAIKVAAVAGAVSLLGYGAYKGYEALMVWWQDYSEGEKPVKLTLKERDILLSLVEAMAEDVKNVRDGEQKPSVVKQFDIGGLNMPLAIECNFMQHGFIEMYNQCDEQGNNVGALEMFYDQLGELVRSVVDRAEIVPEEVVPEEVEEVTASAA